MTERLLPHFDQAERATLGAILLDREAIVPIAAWLKPEHFYSEKHAWIYESQLACYNRRTPPDLTTVSDELRRAGRLDAIGVGYLIDLTNDVPTAYHVEDYARIVERTATLRQLFAASTKIAQLSHNETDDPETLIAQAEGEIQNILAARQNQRKALSLADALQLTYKHLEAIENGTYLHGIKTRLYDLDNLIGGLGRGTMSIVAARPGVGKSAFCATLAYNIGYADNVPVGIFSLEMSAEEVSDRLLAIHSGLDGERIKQGTLDVQELTKLQEAMGQLESATIHIDDTPSLKIGELRAKARQMRVEHGIDVLIVDYLQLLDGDRGRRSDGETQEVSHISKQLVQLARELNIHVIAVSQLSRAVEHRTDRRPVLADLRSSGQLEQDAYLIMFLYRDEMVNKETDEKGVAEVIVAKHRGGKTGTVKLFYQAQSTKFVSLEAYRSVDGY